MIASERLLTAGLGGFRLGPDQPDMGAAPGSSQWPVGAPLRPAGTASPTNARLRGAEAKPARPATRKE